MFQRPDGTQAEFPNNIYFRFEQLKSDLEVHRQQADDCSFFDFYNRIEKQILFGAPQTPQSVQPSLKNNHKLADLQGVEKKKSVWKLPENHAACIKEIGMSMTRQ